MKLSYEISKEQVLSIPAARGLHGQSKYEPLLREFIASGSDAAKMELEGNDNCRTVYAAIKQYLQRHELPATVIMRRGTIYFLRA